jgi:TolB-like protein/class 3 adenylate cyclase/Tfp pilus assembly protein PilF
MPPDSSSNLKFEIGHVLFVDIVGYSKLLINEQSEQLQTLKEIVRATQQFRLAEAEGKLLRLPTGDGGALVFRTTAEAPVLCAMEISKALKSHPELRVRMGIHSGPVNEVSDLNEQANIAGAGINIAQRVMDCAEAGHILLSRHVAEDLEHYPRWQPYLHDLGECEVKHGARLHVVSLHTDELGNPAVPEKFASKLNPQATSSAIAGPGICLRRWILGVLIGAAIVTAALALLRHRSEWTHAAFHNVASEPTGAVAIPEKSIAVLPFENLSDDKQNAFFTDGVQDEILTDLAKIADLKVISRTSVMQYKTTVARNLREIAQALKVAHILEGSVQRAVNRVRVNAQLIDARTDAHLWAQTYDRDLADVFAIQSEIAKAIADQLQAKLSPKEKAAIEERPTKDLAAYDLYLRAKELIYDGRVNVSRAREDDFTSIQLLEKAIARDPAFLLAYCQLAFLHDDIYAENYDHTEARLALAEENIHAAVQLQPNSGEVHLAQAIHYYWGYRNYDQAREELAKVERALPNNAQALVFLGRIDRRQARWDEAIRNFERAVGLDPRNADTLTDLGETYFRLRKSGEAIAILERARAVQPRSAFVRAFPAWIKVEAKADMAPLRSVLNTIEAEDSSSAAEVADLSFQLALREHDPVAAARALANIPREGQIDYNGFPFPHPWYEALLAKLRQDARATHAAFAAARSEVDKIVHTQPGGAQPMSMLGLIDAELGEKDTAIQEGRTACDMLPVAKDAVYGALLITNLARVYSLTGEKDLALEQLDAVNNVPWGPTYGQLRLDSEWDSLRGDPRFEKIVASLAPKIP